MPIDFPDAPALNDTLTSGGVTWTYNGTAWTVAIAGGGGDVVGPASAVDDRIATFDGITGKLIQDSGALLSDYAAASGFTNMVALTQAAYDALTPDANTLYFIT